MIIMIFFFSRYAGKFRANYQNDRWNGSVLRRNEGLPWWCSQRVRLYVCGHVTQIWLSCCYTEALYTKGHLTSIAGSNRRPIQLNLFAISVHRSGWLYVWGWSSTQAIAKAKDIFNSSLPNDRLGESHTPLREALVWYLQLTTSAFEGASDKCSAI